MPPKCRPISVRSLLRSTWRPQPTGSPSPGTWMPTRVCVPGNRRPVTNPCMLVYTGLRPPESSQPISPIARIAANRVVPALRPDAELPFGSSVRPARGRPPSFHRRKTMTTASRIEPLLSRALDSITDPLILYDRDFRIVTANQAAVTIHQRDLDQWMGRHCYEVFYRRGSVCKGCHVRDVFRSGEPRMREKDIRLPDGRLRHFEIRAYPVKDAEGTIVHVLEHGRDISERKTLETQVRTSEERYQTIVETAREGIFIADGDARVTFANKRLAGMLGYDLEEIMGRSLFDLMDEDSKGAAKEQLDRRRKGLSDVYELSFRNREGTSLVGLVSAAPLMVNDAFLGSVGIVTDITRMKQVESELRTAKDFSEKIIDNITDNLIVVDPVTHHIVQANTSFLHRVGFPSEKVIGKPCYEIMLGRNTPCWEDGIHCPVREAAAIKRPDKCDKVYLNADGQERMLQVLTYPLFNSSGGVDLVIRMEHDVTEKRRMEEALAFRSKELQRTQHQLETLFEVSRRVGAESSLQGLVHFLRDFAEGIFPDSDLLFLLLETTGERFLFQEESHPDAIQPLQSLQGGPDGERTVSELARYLRTLKDPRVRTSADGGDLHPLIRRIAEGYPSWFGLPVIVRQECIGYFLLGSKTNTIHSPEDRRFFQALFAQIAGHVRSLILHETEIGRFRREPGETVTRGEIIGQSKKIREVYDRIDLVASSDATVLITGENGTGKELVARAIHYNSRRADRMLVPVNCSAIPSELLESELFGHVRGAFTGAHAAKQGQFEMAHRGTIFLDEIAEMSPPLQAKILRVLQEQSFLPVGGTKTVNVDARILAATNKDLEAEIEQGRFRQDLYFRLNVIPIRIPPLRERPEDIPLLLDHFLRKFAAGSGRIVHGFRPEAAAALRRYPWPGNVRELENLVERLVVLTRTGWFEPEDLPPNMRKEKPSAEEEAADLAEGPIDFRSVREAFGDRLIRKALDLARGNKNQAAKMLGLKRTTFLQMLKRKSLHGP
ncbi:MAG TPA: hypothetical protein DD658_01885 [Deltaproteobacteria bacterium]|nr:hypothetical protein [Deltaproteobacteria bacterium]